MSRASQQPGRVRASRLLSRVLVVAGAVAGFSTAWLVSNEAHAQTTEPAADQSVTDGTSGIISGALEPSAPLVPRETPLTPVVDTLDGVLRGANSTLEPVEHAVVPVPQEKPDGEVHNGHDEARPLSTDMIPAPEPPPAPELPPAPEDAVGSPVADTPGTANPGAEERPLTKNDRPNAPEQPRPDAHPFSPAPATSGCGIDNGHASPSSFSIDWHDTPRWPGMAQGGIRPCHGTHPLVGVAGPQPGATPD